MDNKIVYLFFLTFVLLETCYCISRKLNTTVLSSDEESCHKRHNTLLHIAAEGPKDTLNYIWNFIEVPSVLVALTNSSSELNVTWSGDPFGKEASGYECIPDRISFSDPAIFAYGISLHKIYEFNDVEDSGKINACSPKNINVLKPNHFVWSLWNKKIKDDMVELEMKGHSYYDKEANITRSGSITLLVNVFGTLDRVSQKPSLLHSENSTQIDLSINDFETNSTFSNSRFAVEVLFVSDGKPEVLIPIHVKKTVNDEFTPGVFEIIEINSPQESSSDLEENKSMFLQWRPISYMSKDRDVMNSTDAIFYHLQTSKEVFQDTVRTILFPYYQKEINNVIVRKLNVSMGSQGDGFYKKTRYNSWTLLVGYNHPLHEAISGNTIVIISNIIGLPILIMVLHGSVTWIRKTTTRRMN